MNADRNDFDQEPTIAVGLVQAVEALAVQLTGEFANPAGDRLPAGTYRGVDYETPSFQDSALWVANADVSEDIVYDLLSKIYTEEGLAHMRSQKKTFKEMAIETGANGIVTPMHPGAARFWKEKGIL